MTTLQRTFRGASNPVIGADESDNAWVVEVLGADNLKLSETRQTKLLGRAHLSVATRALMWGMRVYVLLSLVLIVAQIFISLKH